MHEDRDQCRGDGKRNDEGKEQLHGIPTVFRETNGDLRQFSETSYSADAAAAVSYKCLADPEGLSYPATGAGLPASTT
jgi:hypothetical protein